jgi:hypothetical protein
VERQTGKRLKQLDGPEFPTLLSHIWSAFILLSNSRSMGFSGPNPITYEQIKAWKEVTQTPLEAWEVSALKRLDTIFIRVMNGK